ncbi:protein SCAR3-like isoform X2 [Mangifera indica]|uniref:protein SCAR3-like isoform X2 n=1 Tax=Mangifera indica TaxID=29780 RepID=UPI001CF93B4D|nr:protein SCAR3-like isoform X2 [Mangifera indica]
MPLLRFPVRNEYSLGHPDLYKGANKEDPKAVLDGVAVAGLVGILRQLGDLAEFAAEVFHGLQEQVMTTASRSHRLMVRMQHIEASLPSLEKAVLAQTSHIHFAYTAGSEWHPRIGNEQNHFVYSDLPRFIMDSYEECRDPPHLQLLDKYDAGGPGSCLKRYSDPTFFKRISGSSIGATAEKLQRDKKTRKSKKKRSSQRNGEISHIASMPNHSGRFHMSSQAVNGQSISQTASTIDMKLKSDFGDHSNSFDSRTGSGYIEHVFNLSSSLQPGDQESKESTSSLMQHIDTLDSVFLDESTQILDDNFPCGSSQEQTAPRFSCVTWDEKAEIVGLKDKKCDRGEDPQVLSNRDTPDRGTANLVNDDHMDVMISDEDTPELIFDTNQLDEVESEPDTYMDALNTIESESEIDRDYQTKREVKQYSSDVKNERKEHGINGSMEHDSDHYPSTIESHTVSNILPSNGIPSALNSVLSETIFLETQISGKSSNSAHSLGTDVCACADILDISRAESVVMDGPPAESVVVDGPQAESLVIDGLQAESVVTDGPQAESVAIDGLQAESVVGDACQAQSVIIDGPRAESVISDPSSSDARISGSWDLSGDKVINSFRESQQSHAECSGVQSVTFWTNGNLLGLEPSKPPAFAVSNATDQYYVAGSTCEKVGPPNPALKSDGQKGKPNTLVESAESVKAVSSSSNGKVQLLDSKAEKSIGSQNGFNRGHEGVLNGTSVAVSGTELASDVKVKSTEANHGNDGNSSLVFTLGHRLLVNGFHRKLPLAHSEKSESVGSLVASVLDRDSGNHSDANRPILKTTFVEQFGHGSPLGSLTSSPPLERMKISFNPIDGLETSKLKLKFPDGNQSHEGIRDMFASFQLVPEPAIPRNVDGSDSDDDTFCRSSPYMSDDCPSHQSESNSEQWESDESPGESKDHELYDALSRIPSMETVSSSLQMEGATKNGMHVEHGLQSTYTESNVEPSLSSLDLPSFGAMNPVLPGEIKSTGPKNIEHLENYGEVTPLPPPLPPVQWRVTKPHSDMAAEEQYSVSEAFKHALDLKHLGSIINQQPEYRPSNQLSSKKENTISYCHSEHEDQQKLNRQKKANQVANGKGFDEEDFLHQIRSKSFSLRPTVATRPIFASGPAANVKVTAIIEKAHAIRQVVGSDDGEDDDNWSDS